MRNGAFRPKKRTKNNQKEKHPPYRRKRKHRPRGRQKRYPSRRRGPQTNDIDQVLTLMVTIPKMKNAVPPEVAEEFS